MSDSDPVLREGPITLMLEECRARVGRRQVHLTATECNLLAFFLSRPGETLSRRVMLEGVWGDGYRGTKRTVDTHVQRLRRKLGRGGRRIQTVRGVGYRFSRE